MVVWTAGNSASVDIGSRWDLRQVAPAHLWQQVERAIISRATGLSFVSPAIAARILVTSQSRTVRTCGELW